MRVGVGVRARVGVTLTKTARGSSSSNRRKVSSGSRVAVCSEAEHSVLGTALSYEVAKLRGSYARP